MHHLISEKILFGAAFYDEYRVTGSLDEDLDLMVAAGFNVIRVGESVWSTWEPRDGEFNTAWLGPILDGAHRRGISVILGTPTYAVPQWLQKLHPEIAAEAATNVAVPWGSRQEINFAHPTFRWFAERIIRKVVAEYAAHPAVIGFQVDNEPGLFLLHNKDVFIGFQEFLRRRYGSVDNLNDQWGLTYWSHRVNGWAELWTPDGNHSPQYQLEWRRYQCEVVNDFISWQADLVREYAAETQFVTTCISYERPAADDVTMVSGLDITAGNPYYKMQDALKIGVEVARPEMWWSSGVWGLYEQGDRMFSSKQGPFLVTETNAQSIGQSHWQNHPPYPGQIALSAFSLISRGARMIEYWQWQTLHAGIETYWGGVLPHSGKPGRVYREVAALGASIVARAPLLRDFLPDSDVAFLYSGDTKRSFEYYPPLALEDGSADPNSYLRIFDTFYRGAFEARAQVRIVHPSQLAASEVDDLVREFPVLCVPTLYVASDVELEMLAAYAAAGGHLIVGIRTGYGDDIARARPEVAPARISGAAGVSYDEYSNLDIPVPLESMSPTISAGKATSWADSLVVAEGTEVLMTYGGGIYDRQAAVTTRASGAGRVTYVGTLPDRGVMQSLFEWAASDRLANGWEAASSVVIASGTSRQRGATEDERERVWFVSSWGSEDTDVTAPVTLYLEGSEPVPAGTPIRVAAWQVIVATQEPT